MNLNLKFDFKKITESKSHLISAVGGFWQRVYKYVLLIFLIGMISFGALVWQRSLTGGQWSEQKKQEYLNTANKGVIFKEAVYQKVLADIEARKQNSNTAQQPVRDVFKAY